MNLQKPRQPGSAYDALDQFIDQCGGPKVLADFAAVRLSTAYSWTDPDQSKGTPFATLCQLTRHYGATAAAEHLAACAGGVFVPMPKGNGALLENAAALSVETADAVSAIIRSICERTGRPVIDAAMHAEINEELFDVLRVVGRLIAEVNAKHARAMAGAEAEAST